MLQNVNPTTDRLTNMNARPGRPPKRANGTTTLTLRIPAEDKNLLIDTAEALDLTITDYLLSLVRRDQGA
jgi:hypothetical protein